MPPTLLTLLVLTTAALVGCVSGDAPADDVDASVDADGPLADEASPPSAVCPSSPPAAGSSCPCADSCEYGSDPDVRCDTLMTGSHGQWIVAESPAADGCGAALAVGCPATYAALSASPSCDALGATCAYPEARCTCASRCDDDARAIAAPAMAGGVWCCPDALASPPPCPSVRPRIGSACVVAGQACDYGSCSGNVNLECLGGVWVDVPLDCAR